MAEGDLPRASAADRARAMAELQGLTGFHISLANTMIKAHFHKNFGRLALTQKQIAILWLVQSCPGIIQVELARMLRVKRATMSAMIRLLTGRGLVARRALGGIDSRHVPLQLTREGDAVLDEARVAIDRHEAWVKQRYSQAERRMIAALMQKLYEDAG